MRGERRVQLHIRRRVEQPEAVGADQPHAGVAADREQLPLTPGPLLARLRKAGGDHEQRPNTLGRAVARDLEHLFRAGSYNRQLDRIRELAHRTVGAHAPARAWRAR